MVDSPPTDLVSLWRIALGEIELSVSKANFTTWFKNVSLARREHGLVIMVAPNIFTREWLENKYHTVILAALQRIDPTIQNIRCEISAQPAVEARVVQHATVVVSKRRVDFAAPLEYPPGPTPLAIGRGMAEPAATPETALGKEDRPEERGTSGTWDKISNLNARYTFETFVVGANNELAYAAAQAVARRPGSAYNPLFIYGGVGLGKTHLLQAVGNAIRRDQIVLRVRYVTSEKFMHELITAIQNKLQYAFKDRYRAVDVLIIDDVQFLTGKEKTQDELFHTFNDLHGSGRQVVFSSDRPPKAIATLEERLRSRFEGGMVADIGLPDLETRIAILKAKCAAREPRFVVPDDVLAYMATEVTSNIRELEGCLNRVLVHCELRDDQPTLARVREIIGGLLAQPKRRVIHADRILEVVSSYYHIPVADLVGESRRKEVVGPRQVAMYLLRSENGFSFPTIGQCFGGRDHTTAMHACGKIGDALETNEMLQQDLVTIRQKLYVVVGV